MESGFSDWKVPENSGRVRKFFVVPEKSHMEGNMGGTHVASGPRGPTMWCGRIKGGGGVLVGLELPLQSELGRGGVPLGLSPSQRKKGEGVLEGLHLPPWPAGPPLGPWPPI